MKAYQQITDEMKLMDPFKKRDYIRKEYINKEFITRQGYTVVVLDVILSTDIIIQFKSHKDIIKHVTRKQLHSGLIPNPYYPTYCNLGFIGNGKYKSNDKSHSVWHSMFDRCYSIEAQKRVNSSSYKDCEVCEEWCNFQNFASWYNDNYYEIEGEKMEIDKDILSYGNRIYSSDYCLFVPKSINLLLAHGKVSKNNTPTPIGVGVDKSAYRVNIIHNGNKIHESRHQTIREAFVKYAEMKKEIIINVANKYKESIPNKLYRALLDYQVYPYPYNNIEDIPNLDKQFKDTEYYKFKRK